MRHPRVETTAFADVSHESYADRQRASERISPVSMAAPEIEVSVELIPMF
jgi:hypothetical protein